MHFFTAIATFGLVAFASAQSSTNVTEPVSSTSAAAPATTSLNAQERCLRACAASDICCQARCVGVPCPNDLQVNQTTECAAQCVQGNGTEEETAAYAACQSSCVSSLFFPLSATAGGAAATGTGSGAGGSDATATASGTGIGADESSASETDASASASSTSDSGNGAVRNSVAGAGLLGLIVAGLAL